MPWGYSLEEKHFLLKATWISRHDNGLILVVKYESDDPGAPADYKNLLRLIYDQVLPAVHAQNIKSIGDYE